MSFIHRPASGRPTLAPLPAAVAAAALVLLGLAGPSSALAGQAGLYDAFVGPRTGTPTTTIRFSVTFQGAGDPAGVEVDVVIDGTSHEMARALSDTLASGSRYRYSTTLPVGTHGIVFTGHDALTDDSLEAGTVTISDGSSPSPSPSASATPLPSLGNGGDTTTGGTGGTGDGSATSSPAPDPGAGASPSPTTGTGGSGGSSGGDSAGPTPAPTSTTGGGNGAGSSTGTSTGGGQANATDAPGAADHTNGGGSDSSRGGGGAVPTEGPAVTDPGAAAPPATDDPNGSQVADAIGDPTGPGTALGDGGGDRGDSRADDRTIELLSGGGSISPTERMIITAISTTATTTVAMAFLMFGKRRRDDDPPAPDEVLSVNAGRLAMTPASAIASGEAGGRAVDESAMPRWRRPSLLEQRKADPLRSTATHAAMSFHHGTVVADAGLERRRIRYRAVSLLDAPDELRAAEIGYLDEGDEVQLVERSGGYWLVVCPNGSRGWLHRMTLGEVVVDDRGGHTTAAWRSENRTDAGAEVTSADDPAGDDPDDDGLDGGGSFGAYLRHHRR